MVYPNEYRYTREHEWVKIERDGKAALVGITHHAQDQLGDVVFVDLPAVGAALQAGSPFGAVESVKAVSDVYAPISGAVTEVNEELLDAPERVNDDPHGAGWMVRMTVGELGELEGLMSAEEYAEYAAAEAH